MKVNIPTSYGYNLRQCKQSDIKVIYFKRKACETEETYQTINNRKNFNLKTYSPLKFDGQLCSLIFFFLLAISPEVI